MASKTTTAEQRDLIELYDATYDALRHLSAELQILRAAACYNGESLDNEDLEYYCVEMADHAEALMNCLNTWKERTMQAGKEHREEGRGAGLIEQTIELLHRLPEDKQRIVYHFVKALAGNA